MNQKEAVVDGNHSFTSTKQKKRNLKPDQPTEHWDQETNQVFSYFKLQRDRKQRQNSSITVQSVD